jgi:hypothetical protein
MAERCSTCAGSRQIVPGEPCPDCSPPREGEGERWTIWVCDGCGAYGGMNELDPWGNHLVHHGESLHAGACVRAARQVEVVPASLADQLREELADALAGQYKGPVIYGTEAVKAARAEREEPSNDTP